MVGAANLRALSTLCSERDTVLADIVEFYGLTDEPAQGVTARDRAKDLPIRILHGGGHAAWLSAQGLPATQQVLPLVKQLEAELRVCRREVYEYMQQHDSEWLRVVEDHVRGAQAPRPGAGAVTGPRATTAAARAAAEHEAWLREKVAASVFARVLQDIEDRCLDCVRRVLQAEGWPARSWQQDGLLVEDEGGRRLRGGGGGDEAKARLEVAMRKAEAEVMREHEMEVSLLVKSFFEAPVEDVLQRMAGAGGRRPSVAEAREVARRARAAGERPSPPPRAAPSRVEAAKAAAAAAAAERRSQALDAELREVTRARRDVMERRRARLEGVHDDGGDDDDGDDDDGGARRDVDGAARDGGVVESGGDDVGGGGSDTGGRGGGDEVSGGGGDAGERGGGDGEVRHGGAAAAVGGDDAGDNRRDDGEGVSRGGTPAPLSAGSGATLGGTG